MPNPLAPQPILPIELVALDIDGTLIGDDLIIGPDTKKAVAAALARGVVVCIVTGRMVSSAMRFARELELVGPVVGYQGGLIRAMPDPGSTRLGKLLYHRPIRADVAGEIVAWARAHGLDPHVNHLERFILQADDPNADDYSAFMGARAELVTDLATSIDHPVTKVLAVAEPPVPTEVAPLARERFLGAADVTISHPKFLEFVAPGVSKGRAVRWLARRLGVQLGATLAMGDQWNDFEMLGEVGHGAAMPSAPAAVRAVARYIAPPLEDEGVARMIEGLVLARPAAAQAASDRMTEEADAARDAARNGADLTAGPGEAGQSQPEATTAADQAEAVAEASPEPERRTA